MDKFNIRKKLQGIQSSLKAPKGQTNKFGGYSYRSCEDILTALKPLLATSNILSLGIANGKSLTAVLESLKLLSTAPRQFANTLTAQKIMTVLIAGSKYAKTTVTFTIAQSGTLRVKTGLAKSASQKRRCCPMYAPN